MPVIFDPTGPLLYRGDPDGTGPTRLHLIAAGSFQVPFTTQSSKFASIDLFSGAWSLTAPGYSGTPYALVEFNGDLILGGPSGLVSVERWNGAAWEPLAGQGGLPPIPARDLAVLPNGQLIAVGEGFVASWDGVQWTQVGPSFDGPIHAIAVTPLGNMYVGGLFESAGDQVVNNIARWNGLNWEPLGGGITGQAPVVLSLAVMSNGSIAAAGHFDAAGVLPCTNVALWNHSSWSPLGAGMNQPVHSVVATPEGGLIAGGSFTMAGGAPARRVATWNGGGWTELGGGVEDGAVRGIAILPTGDIALSGTFVKAGSIDSPRFALWTRCRSDHNNSQTISTQDLFAYLSDWFHRERAADFDENGSVSVQDLFDFLRAWLSGC